MSESKTISANGHQFIYIEEGSGDALILVHGTLGDYRTWRRQMKALGKHFRTVSYSRRYHFPDMWKEGNGDYTMSGHADDLAALIAALNAHPAHLVCASWGGNVGMRVAISHPHIVRTLVLCEPPSLPLLEADETLKHVVADFYRETLDPARDALKADRFEDGVRIFIDGVMGVGSYRKLSDGVKKYFMQNAAELKAELTSPNYFAPLTKSILTQIECPVMLVTGENSPRMFHKIIDIIKDAAPTATHVEIPGASHGIHADNAPAFNAAVLNFVQSENEKAPT